MRFICAVTAAAALAIVSSAATHAQSPTGPAATQTWPDKPVRIIVPYVAGGPTDAIARILSEKLGERWKQPTVIESRPGAGSNTGSTAVARSTPDGYTLLVNTTAIAVNQTLFKAPGYDTLKDFSAIINVAQAPNLILGTKSLKATTLKDALEEARTGKLSYGSPGSGTTPHLTMEYLFKGLAKVDVVHVPFKGGGDMTTAALSGAVQFASGAVPTVAESGFKDFEDYTWIGFFAPSATPAAITQKINADMNAVLQIADVRERLTKIGFEIVGGDTASFTKYVEREIAKWAGVVKSIGINQL